MHRFLLSLALDTALIGTCAPSKHVLKCKYHQDISTFIAGAAGLDLSVQRSSSQHAGGNVTFLFQSNLHFSRLAAHLTAPRGPGSGCVVLELPLACFAGCMDLSPLGMGTEAEADLGY